MRRVNFKSIAKWTALLPVSAQLLAISPAAAQDAADRRATVDDAPGEIVVTARKVPETLLEAPLSVTSISAETIGNAGLGNIADAIGFSPNVDMGGGLAGQLQGQISIRGISTLVRNIGLETGVGIYVDGVFVGRPENFSQDLLDIERVEIIRGPQSTEYGKNTIAGVISLQSRQPDSVDANYVELEGGSYDYLKGAAAVGGSVSDALSVRGAISYARQDGFYKHLSDGKDAGATDLLTWRVGAKLAFDNISFILRGDGLRDRGTPGFFQADALAGFPPSFPSNRPHRINNNRPNRLSRDNAGVSLTASWTLGDVDIISITAYRDSSYDAALDDDQEQVDFVAGDDFADDSELFTQELRATGRLGALHYLVGGYYFDQTVETDRSLALGADLGVPGGPALSTLGRVKTQSRALFGRLDYDVTSRFQLSGGLRYTSERKRAGFTQHDPSGIFAFLGFPNLTFADRSSDDDFSPSASASYAVADGVNLYGRYAKGFKSAAFNVDIASSLNGLTARPEKATSYEAGVKMQLLGNNLWVNLAAFHTDYDSLQVSQILGNGLALSNAGKAKIRGFEGEFAYQAPFGLRLEAQAGILDAEYTHFENCGIPMSVGGGVGDCSGNDLALAPHFSGHAAIQYETSVGFGRLFARADLDHRSSIYFEPSNAEAFRAGDRTLLNLRLGVRRERWDVTAWAQNVTKVTYRTYADDRSAVGVFRTASYGAPRTFGVTLRVRP